MIVFFVFLIFIILIILDLDLSLKERFKSKSKNKREKLMSICGLPSNYNETSHCFADSTHQTCCMLGPEARKYADNSGNPIGRAAELANKGNSKLKPWCTCFGSKVCSYYSKKFNDGTHIKFVNNPSSPNMIRKHISPDCEGYFRDKFSIKKHGTPGINNSEFSNNINSECLESGVDFNLD